MMRRLSLALLLALSLSPAFGQAPPPVPALPDAERRTSYVISGSTCSCAVGFQLYGDSTDVANWLEVWVNGVRISQSGNWTITSPTGSLATIPRPITNAVLTFTVAQTGTVQIVGARRPRRTSQFLENRGVAARDMNQVLSDLTAQLRENWDKTNDVTGRAVIAPPGETLAMLPAAANRLNQGACFDSVGNLAPCVSVPGSTFTAGTGITFTGTNPTTISITPTPTTQSPVVPSRATAMTLDLSALSVVQSGGYSTGGDGGHGVFKNVGSAPFIDSFISTFSIQGGSGCTNGTYGAPSGSISTTAIIWNKAGNPSFAIGTATVAGNVLTAVNITGTPGNAYSVGDVLTAGGVFTGCSVQPTITVTGVTAPLASFTDFVGTHFQFVPNAFPNALQFGCKGDWNGTDGTATDNFACMQAAVNFAAYKSSISFDSGGFWGGRVIVPSGSYKVCGSSYFVLPEGTVLQGASEPGSSQLHLCDAFNTTINAFMICDPVWGFACLGARYENIAFHTSRSVAVSGGIFMIYSNNLQDFGGLHRVYVYGGQRGCFHFEKGYGGSSWVGAEKVSCNIGSPNNPMVRLGNTVASGMNFGSTMVSLRDIVIGGPSSSPFHLQSGIQVYGGFTNIENVHCELINGECIYLESPASGNPIQMRFTNINAQGCVSGGTCLGIITLASVNDPGNVILSMIPPAGSYTHVVNNGQPGAVHYNAAIKGPLICTTTCHTEVIP